MFDEIIDPAGALTDPVVRALLGLPEPAAPQTAPHSPEDGPAGFDCEAPYRFERGYCDVWRIAETHKPEVAADKWTTTGNATVRGDELVFSPDPAGGADGFASVTLELDPGVSYWFSFEAGHYQERGQGSGTDAAFRVEAVAGDREIPIAHSDETIRQGIQRSYLRPFGLAFQVPESPGGGKTKIKIRFHDKTDRRGVALDLRVKPIVGVAQGFGRKEVNKVVDPEGNCPTFYVTTGIPRPYEPRGRVSRCDDIKKYCPTHWTADNFCDLLWDHAADDWAPVPIVIRVDVPCNGGFTYTYTTTDGEPYELGGRIGVCDPLPPKPKACPYDEYASCTQVNAEGTWTYTTRTHTPCDGDPEDFHTFGGEPFTPSGKQLGCEDTASKAEAEERERHDPYPRRELYSCKDVTDTKTITHTKAAITDREGGDPVYARTYGGDDYELGGKEKICTPVENEEEARELEGECDHTSDWYSCIDRERDGDVTYTKEVVRDCDGDTVDTRRTLHGKPYRPDDDPEDCEKTTEEEARRREGKKNCPTERKELCTETVKPELSAPIFLSSGTVRTTKGVRTTVLLGTPRKFSHNPRGFIRTEGRRPRQVYLKFSEPVWVEFSCTWMQRNETASFPDQPVEATGDGDPRYTWSERSRMLTALSAGSPSYSLHFGMRTTEPVTSLLMLSGSVGGDGAMGIADLRLAPATEGGTHQITKITVTECDGTVREPRYEKNGRAYTPTGEVSDCKPA